MKPTIIYISGAPGSGKTTLAEILSKYLYMPHISSDLIHGGIEYTHPGHDRKSAIESVFVPMMIQYAKNNISFVVDQVLQKDIAKATIIDRLLKYANITYIHVQTEDPISRYIDRIKESKQPDIVRRRELLLERASHHKANLSNTVDAIELGIPTIVVDTRDGYSPTISEIVAFISKNKH